MDLLERAFAAAYDPAMRAAERAGLARLRRELLGGLTGRVVELGAGTGANLAAYGDGLDQLVLLEPSPPMAGRLEAAVRSGRRARVDVRRAPAEALPFADASVDAVVATLVLCTVDDPDRVYAEVARVLRPGGRLVLLEHVTAPDAGTERLQRLLERPWRAVGRGCRLRRDPRDALTVRGWDVGDLREVTLPLPAPTRSGLVGTAVPPPR